MMKMMKCVEFLVVMLTPRQTVDQKSIFVSDDATPAMSYVKKSEGNARIAEGYRQG